MPAIDAHAAIVETAGVGAPTAPTGEPLQLHWLSEEDTRSFAQALAGQVGILKAFIALQGELGSGKTTLVRHLLRCLGLSGRIKSPTYAVLESHQLAGPDGALVEVSHFDFYRFNDRHEFDAAGFRELFAAPGLKLAEWPEKVGPALPLPDLWIELALLPDGSRQVKLDGKTALGRALIARPAKG